MLSVTYEKAIIGARTAVHDDEQVDIPPAKSPSFVRVTSKGLALNLIFPARNAGNLSGNGE